MNAFGVFNQCQFLAYVVHSRNMPKESCPEVAFLGRSNVGKSSLLNALIGKKGFARVSKTPGRTQAVHFYGLGEDEGRIIDLPGYGYAHAPTSQRKKWPQLIEYYLIKRKTLRKVFLLLDATYPPKTSDEMMRDFLEAVGLPYACVLTKADRISAAKRCEHIEFIKNHFLKGMLYGEKTVFCASVLKKTGIDEIKKDIITTLLK